jgi:hypothetical protein
MPSLIRHLVIVTSTGALISPILMSGCAAHVSSGYRTHDYYANDDHVWGNDETRFYASWETDTHRSHKDYRKRNADEQKDYWQYRHSHQ